MFLTNELNITATIRSLGKKVHQQTHKFYRRGGPCWEIFHFIFIVTCVQFPQNRSQAISGIDVFFQVFLRQTGFHPFRGKKNEIKYAFRFRLLWVIVPSGAFCMILQRLQIARRHGKCGNVVSTIKKAEQLISLTHKCGIKGSYTAPTGATLFGLTLRHCNNALKVSRNSEFMDA